MPLTSTPGPLPVVPVFPARPLVDVNRRAGSVPQAASCTAALRARNLDVVDLHIRGEAVDVDAILGLYTDDIVLEVPGRGLRLAGRDAIRANYLAMWPAMADVALEPLDRFATEDRVVDDMIVRMRLVGDGMVNAPVPIGTRVELRLIHHFTMRDGLISREQVFEVWQALPEEAQQP
jgi:ketosteroid isomerase-like protein